MVKLWQTAKIMQIFQKKYYIYQRAFLANLMIAQSDREAVMSDSPQIMANVTQHMIYLAGALKHRPKQSKS